MSKYMIIDPFIGNPSPASATATSQQFALGLIARGEDKLTGASSLYRGAGEFVYAQGSNVASVGQFVMLSNNSAVLLASANSASAFPIAAGVPLYLAATAGYVNSVAGAGSRVQGVVAPVSYTSSQSASLTVQLFRAFGAGH